MASFQEEGTLEGKASSFDDGKIALLKRYGISMSTVKQVCEWGEHYLDHSYQSESGAPSDICAWDQDFLDKVDSGLLDLYTAANILDIPMLMKICEDRIAVNRDRNTKSGISGFGKFFYLFLFTVVLAFAVFLIINIFG